MLTSPTIRGPVLVGCTRVWVDGCIPSLAAQVVLTRNGTRLAAATIRGTSARLFVPSGLNDIPLEAEDALRVYQLTPDQVQAKSPPDVISEALFVGPSPNPLPPPTFGDDIFLQSRWLRLTRVTPGSTVVLSQGGSEIGRENADGDSVHVRLTRQLSTEPINAFVERLGSRSTATASMIPRLILDAVSGPPKRLRKLTSDAVAVCGRSIAVAEGYAGSLVTLKWNQVGGSQRILDFEVDDSASNLVVSDEFQLGDQLSLTQRFQSDGWDVPSDAVHPPVMELVPQIDNVEGFLCRDGDNSWIRVRGTPGALVHLRHSGVDLITGIINSDTGVGEVRVPSGLLPSDASELALVAELCKRRSVPPWPTIKTEGAVAVPPSPNTRDFLPNELYDCSRVVRVTGVPKGAVVWLRDEATYQRLGLIVATGFDDAIALNQLPAVGKMISLEHYDCFGQRNILAVRHVVERPKSVIKLVPPFDGDTSVRVRSIIPGSRVDVLIDGQILDAVNVADFETDVMCQPLRAGQTIEAREHGCSGQPPAGSFLVVAPKEEVIVTVTGSDGYALMKQPFNDPTTQSPIVSTVDVAVTDSKGAPLQLPQVKVELPGGIRLSPGTNQKVTFTENRPGAITPLALQVDLPNRYRLNKPIEVRLQAPLTLSVTRDDASEAHKTPLDYTGTEVFIDGVEQTKGAFTGSELPLKAFRRRQGAQTLTVRVKLRLMVNGVAANLPDFTSPLAVDPLSYKLTIELSGTKAGATHVSYDVRMR